MNGSPGILGAALPLPHVTLRACSPRRRRARRQWMRRLIACAAAVAVALPFLLF